MNNKRDKSDKLNKVDGPVPQRQRQQRRRRRREEEEEEEEEVVARRKSSMSTTSTTRSSSATTVHPPSLILEDLVGDENDDDDDKDKALNPYSVLRIRKDATKHEIKQAYRRHALLYHPCRRGTRLEWNQKEQEHRLRVFTILAACCETLLERDSRARLDSILAGPLHGIQAAPANAPAQQQQRRRHSIGDISFLHPISTSRTCSSSDDDELHPDDDDDDDDAMTQTQQSTWCPCPLTSTSQQPSLSSNQKKDAQQQQQQQQQRQHGRTMHTKSSSSTEEHDSFHYTQEETDRLFGGPLWLMYRARMFRPFSDPFAIFDQVFGHNIFPKTNDETKGTSPPTTTTTTTTNIKRATSLRKKSKVAPLDAHHPGPARTSTTTTTTKPASSQCTGTTIETLPNGTTVYITSRILHGRKLTKRETIAVDPHTGKKKSTITVTSEDLPNTDEHENDKNRFAKTKTRAKPLSANNMKHGDSKAVLSFDYFSYLDCCSHLDLFSQVDFTTQEYTGAESQGNSCKRSVATMNQNMYQPTSIPSVDSNPVIQQ